MCDDWTDLMTYVVQKYLRRVQARSQFEISWIPKRPNDPDNDNDSLSRNLEQIDKRFGRNQSERPRTEIESLINQILNSGLFLFSFLLFTN